MSRINFEEGADAIAPFKDLEPSELANLIDENDSLSEFRSKFQFPDPSGEAKYSDKNNLETVYLCGNSLGLMPKNTPDVVNYELEKWGKYGVAGHFSGEMPWFSIDEYIKDSASKIVGATPSEVAMMNSLSLNIHLLFTFFYRPEHRNVVFPDGATKPTRPCRYKIMIEDHAFGSDVYAVKSQLNLHGYSVEEALVVVKPREGESCIREEDIVALIEQHKDELAIVFLGGIHYYTGQMFNIPLITKAAHDAGAYCGWDLAHVAGNVPLRLHDWDVDFAVWCSYKYLNSGPGGIAGAFLHDKYDEKTLSPTAPRLCGWWGHRREDRGKMAFDFHPSRGIASFQLSNPPIFQVASYRSSLSVFEEAGGMDVLRKKSLVLTAFLEHVLQRDFKDSVTIVTPSDPDARGCQLSISFKDPSVPVGSIQKLLQRENVIVDSRQPSVIRVAPVPLYNSATDVYRFTQILAKVLEEWKATAAQ